MNKKTWTKVRTAEDVTPEILGMASMVVTAWFASNRTLPWLEVWDRMDGRQLSDGTYLDLGSDLSTSAFVKLKQHIRKIRQEAGEQI